MFVVSVTPSEKLHSVVWWLLGNLQIFDWGLLRIVSAVVAAGLAVSVLFATGFEPHGPGGRTGGTPGP